MLFKVFLIAFGERIDLLINLHQFKESCELGSHYLNCWKLRRKTEYLQIILI